MVKAFGAILALLVSGLTLVLVYRCGPVAPLLGQDILVRRGANASAFIQENFDPQVLDFFADELLNMRRLNLETGELFDALDELDRIYASYQPSVVFVEAEQATKLWGSLCAPEGTPWCGGLPTYWLIGHQNVSESPWCRQRSGNWVTSARVVLDSMDSLNSRDGDDAIDRHDCVKMDINKDGLVDIVCLVGADRGQGRGFNEVYLTQRGGTIRKVPTHGLQKYPSMRNRLAVALKTPSGEDLIYIATNGADRGDGSTNAHRMFKNVYKTNPGLMFQEINGPFNLYSNVDCLVAADINGDGMDDLLVCNKRNPAFIFTQSSTGSWTRVGLGSQGHLIDWQNLRVADMDGDGLVDLLVVGWGQHSVFRVFQGISTSPYFNFNNPIFQENLDYFAADLEVLDVNSDGLPDVYIVMDDRSTKGTYCAAKNRGQPNAFWGYGANPLPGWVPPNDQAPDILYIGSTDVGLSQGKKLVMEHSLPGCGFYAERFGDGQSMVLGQGNTNHAGHNFMLQWTPYP